MLKYFIYKIIYYNKDELFFLTNCHIIIYVPTVTGECKKLLTKIRFIFIFSQINFF